ncbi:MAG: zinc ribbon domain-containing protein [Bacillota bacterium]
MAKKKRKEKNTAFKQPDVIRYIVIFWLLILALSFIVNNSIMGLIFVAVMIYLILMDRVNDRITGGRRKADNNPDDEDEYDPSEHGETIKCPYCGKKIQSELNYCFYCGKSLEPYKRIEAVRVGNLTQIDTSIIAMDDSPSKERILQIRDLTDKILRKYAQKPEEYADYERFIDYYLPKTVAAIRHYNVLCTLNNLDSNELKIKKQLEDSFDLLAEAFSNIYNRASTEGLEDVAVDVTVLENIMKQEGLTDSDFE